MNDVPINPVRQFDLLAVVRGVCGVNWITVDTELVESGLLTSLIIVDLVCMIEEHVGLMVPTDSIVPSAFSSVGALNELIQSLLEGGRVD